MREVVVLCCVCVFVCCLWSKCLSGKLKTGCWLQLLCCEVPQWALKLCCFIIAVVCCVVFGLCGGVLEAQFGACCDGWVLPG